jgi:hypothetical protein
MTRALCALAHGDVAAAIGFHPLSPLVFLVFTAMAASGLFRLAGWHPPSFWLAPATLPWTIAVFALFGVLRITVLTL